MSHASFRPYRAVALLSMVLTGVPAAAQTGSAVIQGTVMDATKGAIPNAKASLTNTATGVARSAETNSVGFFYFGAVQPGP